MGAKKSVNKVILLNFYNTLMIMKIFADITHCLHSGILFTFFKRKNLISFFFASPKCILSFIFIRVKLFRLCYSVSRALQHTACHTLDSN